MADRPRWWKSGSVYSEVRNCIDNMFLLKPSPEIRNIIGACLGRAQAQFPVKIYWVDPNVTHEHRGREPYEGMEQNMSDFDQLYYSLLTKELNTLEKKHRGEREKAGSRPAGPKKLMKLDPRGRPKHPKKRRRRPLCHASTVKAADAHKESWRTFLDERFKASQLFLDGNLYVEFPKGAFRPR